MDSTTFLCWNVCGLCSRARRDIVMELVTQERISVMCLQETKLDLSCDNVILSMLDSKYSHCVAS
jgi:exonuclease III